MLICMYVPPYSCSHVQHHDVRCNTTQQNAMTMETKALEAVLNSLELLLKSIAKHLCNTPFYDSTLALFNRCKLLLFRIQCLYIYCIYISKCVCVCVYECVCCGLLFQGNTHWLRQILNPSQDNNNNNVILIPRWNHFLKRWFRAQQRFCLRRRALESNLKYTAIKITHAAYPYTMLILWYRCSHCRAKVSHFTVSIVYRCIMPRSYSIPACGKFILFICQHAY